MVSYIHTPAGEQRGRTKAMNKIKSLILGAGALVVLLVITLLGKTSLCYGAKKKDQ